MTFNRAEIVLEKARLLQEQAQDAELFDLGREFIIRSDKHGYANQWTWCGLAIIQIPQGVLAVQQIMWKCRSSVVIETGVARGRGNRSVRKPHGLVRRTPRDWR